MVYKFFAKKSGENGVDTSRANKSAMNPIINLQMNFTNRSSENLKDEKSIHLLETIFGVLT